MPTVSPPSDPFRSSFFVSRRERRAWLAAGGLVLLIYSTLYWVRDVSDWLRDQGFLVPSLVLGFCGAALLVLRSLARSRPSRREIAVLAVAGAAFLPLFPLLRKPEEATHFLQYGALGVLVYAALAERLRVRGVAGRLGPLAVAVRTGLGAVLVTTLLGWGDELIQAVLPNRYYDLRDVAFNAAAGALAAFAAAGRGWARATSPAAGPTPDAGARTKSTSAS